jgi:CRP/FNR family transcriptional regulator, cyclic AMP receptor protein
MTDDTTDPPRPPEPAGAADAPPPAHSEDAIVQAIAAHGVKRRYPRNSVIIAEGDPSDWLYVILSGRVKVFLSDENGREIVLAIRGPNEYVGEMALDSGVRTASVMTIENCELAVVSQQAFRDFIANDPAVAFSLIRKLISRARQASDHVRNLALLDVYGRIARLLLDLAVEEGGEMVIAEALTQQDIAERVGCSREMVSRIFTDLTSGGYIRIEGRRIHIERTLPKRW